MTTANPPPDTSQALVAGVRVISDILRERVRERLGDAGDASTLLIYVEELEAHLATVESELGELRTREAALAEFVEYLLDNTHGDKEWYVKEARLLLAKLAEGKTT